MLFGRRATDAVSLFAALGLLLAVAAVAGYLPARRASLIDPMVETISKIPPHEDADTSKL